MSHYLLLESSICMETCALLSQLWVPSIEPFLPLLLLVNFRHWYWSTKYGKRQFWGHVVMTKCSLKLSVYLPAVWILLIWNPRLLCESPALLKWLISSLFSFKNNQPSLLQWQHNCYNQHDLKSSFFIALQIITVKFYCLHTIYRVHWNIC